MKKQTKIILIVVGIIVALLLIATIFFVAKLVNKEVTPITAEEFKTEMEKRDFTIATATTQFAEADYVKQVYIALPSDYSYQIEFYEFTEEQYATSFYNNNKSIFEKTAGSVKAENEINLKNHGKYAISTNGKYSSVIRVGNTAVYISVNDTYKDKVKEMIKKIGY